MLKSLRQQLRSTLAGPFDRDYSELRFDDRGHGYDPFGAHRDWVEGAAAVIAPLYRWYFRVRSYGSEQIPASGPVIVASNHSGTLPFDGAMLYMDIVHHTNPPRLPRPIVDLFVPSLPVVGTTFSRLGVVAGSRGNVHRLLNRGELLLIFPEGTPGIGKPFSERYHLQTWREGHAELAIRHQAPVVPVAMIGPEEQMPQIAQIPVSLFGAPYLPIPLTLLPLPVRYHIHYGAPIPLHRDYRPEQADDPAIVHEAAQRIKDAVQCLLDHGLRQREGVFT
ncbi:MAG: glycerol acyltransferase [Myxococcales bacterium]|nr:glycerol acyltransferase [Myxococcales bacterium]